MISVLDNLFHIQTNSTSYIIGVRNGLLENLYYGAKIHLDEDVLREKLYAGYGSDVVYTKEDPGLSLLHLNTEITPVGKGDFRSNCVELELGDGSYVYDFSYVSHEVLDGAMDDIDLPSAHHGDETLVITLESKQGIRFYLYYTTYPNCDVITRHLRVENIGEKPIVLKKVMSYQLDLPDTGYTLSTFTGAWARERHETRTKVTSGTHTFGSTTGLSSHFVNPFFMIWDSKATEDTGKVYGFNLIYSGSHFGSVEAGPFSKLRIQAGIQPSNFAWTLQSDEWFDTPQAVLTFSKYGKNGMSQNMHAFVKNHIVRGEWANKPRPVLLNNWEGTYFDFKESKLLSMAKDAKKIGVELFVLDDGWFKGRDNDSAGLGDYSLNIKKLPNGLDGLAKKIEALGLQFGLWFEPESMNPDSDLYREHPDWCIHHPDLEPSLGRNQLVLDLCREEVQQYIIENVNRILKSASISYVKWDMNRHISDNYSCAIEEQGRFAHLWAKGAYAIMKGIVEANPTILFEGCSSGGNRFDLGVLCYMPQIWTSDDTDVYERLKIQTGTSYGYPQSVMGCHVSAAPNHQTMRSSPIEARFDVASIGILGYELDITQLTSPEKKVVAAQVEFYKEHRELLQFGEYIRLVSPFDESEACHYMVVSQDRKEAIVVEAMGRLTPNSEQLPIVLRGLLPDTKYHIVGRKHFINIRTFGSLINYVLPFNVNGDGMLMRVASDLYMMPCEDEEYYAYGDTLMEAGLKNKQHFGGTGYNEHIRMMPDYSARMYYLKAVE